MSSRIAEPIEVSSLLRTAGLLFWRQFAPIIGSGLILLVLPAVLVRTFLGSTGQGSAGTVAATLLGMLAMLFVCIVSYGSLAALVGRPLAPRAFIEGGIRAARPGFVVALVLGAIVMTGSIAILLATRFGGGGLASVLLFGVALWGLAALLPAIPVGIVERLAPLDSLRRAADLTRGQRWRLVGMMLLIGLAILPPAMLTTTVVFGANPTPAGALARLAAMTLASPGLWIIQLVDLLIYSFLATLPAVVYARLSGMGGRRP